MKADTLITGISQLVTAAGDGPKRGTEMRELKIIERAAIAIASGVIGWTGKESEWTGEAETVVDAGHGQSFPGWSIRTRTQCGQEIDWLTLRHEHPA